VVGALKNLTPAEHERVNAAIAAAQARTEARFAFVTVHASDRYHLYPVVWGATLALMAFGALALGLPHLAVRFAFAIVAAVFVVASLLLEWQPLRMLAVPANAKRAHARALAHREFAVRILSHPEHAGGMLFFVSLAERYAELIADHALHQAAGQAAWDSIVRDFTAEAARGRLAEAIVRASNACGVLLEMHHPKA
jgi:putative membrane protein